jgi:hypothetical protein
MKHLLIALLTGGIIVMTALDSAAQGRGGRGGGRAGFNNSNDGNDPAPNGAPAQLPQAPADFGAPVQLPQAPANFGAPAQLPQAPANFAPAPPTTPTPAAGAASAAAAPQTAAANRGPAPKTTSVRVVDGLVSVQAKDVQLGQLVKLLDNAMGTKSRVKKELESRPVNVRFDDLPYDAAVRKIFQGVALDYVLVPGEGIIVTSASVATSGGGTSSTPTPTTLTTTTNLPPNIADSPFAQSPQPTVPQPIPGTDPFATTPPPGGAPTPAPNVAPTVAPAPTPAPVQLQQPNFNDPFAPGLQTFGAPAPAAPAPAGPTVQPGFGGATGPIPFGQPF